MLLQEASVLLNYDSLFDYQLIDIFISKFVCKYLDYFPVILIFKRILLS